MAAEGLRVGVVDTDILSPGIHVLFRLEEDDIKYSLNDFLWGKCDMEQAAVDVTTRLSETVTGPLKDPIKGRLYLIPSSMKAGEISDLIKTAFGFHIIKVVDNKPESTRPLAEVRAEIEEQVKWQKAQAEAETVAKSLEATIKSPADLERVARERSLQLTETGLLAQGDAIQGVGTQPELSGRLFGMKEGEVTPAMRVN